MNMKKEMNKFQNGIFYEHLPKNLLSVISLNRIFNRPLTLDELKMLSLIYYSGKNGVSLIDIHYQFGETTYVDSMIIDLCVHGLIEHFYTDNKETKLYRIRPQFMFYALTFYGIEENINTYKEWLQINNGIKKEDKKTAKIIAINDFDNGVKFSIPNEK